MYMYAKNKKFLCEGRFQMKILVRNRGMNVVMDFRKGIVDPKEVLKKWNETHTDQMDEALDITGKHLCKYCGDIVEGEYEDILCEDCKETFGHSLFSEL